MQEYRTGKQLTADVIRTAQLLTEELSGVDENYKNSRVEGIARSPSEMIAYMHGWIALIRSWDATERAGIQPDIPAIGFKWDDLGALYNSFYRTYSAGTLKEQMDSLTDEVQACVWWIESFSDEDLFTPGKRRWTESTPAHWPVARWVYENTIAQFNAACRQIHQWKKQTGIISSDDSGTLTARAAERLILQLPHMYNIQVQH